MKHARDLAGRPPAGTALSSPALDPRWRIVHLAAALREELRLTTSDIAALRGLVFLLPRESWGRQMIVHASNRLLAERSDGLNERTLRRALQRLGACGLLRRQDSANRKRYRLSLSPDDAPICFGLDLSPLLAREAELQAMVEARAAEQARIRSLKTLIRHSLYLLEQKSGPMSPAEITEARTHLRRKLGLDALTSLHKDLQDLLSSTDDMSASDGQNVRHIQKSSPENQEEAPRPLPEAQPNMTQQGQVSSTAGIALEECLEALPSALDFAAERPRNWSDLCRLAESLAPGLGIEPHPLSQARGQLGAIGYAMAVLGLIQSMGRIQNPGAYLMRLTAQSREGALDLLRMFRSLTRTRPRAALMNGIIGLPG